MKEEYMTVAETADFVGCGEWLVRKAIRTKHLTAFKMASRVVIRPSDAAKWWRERTTPKKI